MAIPRAQRTPFTLLSCQLSISCLSISFPRVYAVGYHFTEYMSPLSGNLPGATFRIFSSVQSTQNIPATWEVKWVSPAHGQHAWELLHLLFNEYDHRVINRCVREVISLKEIDDWPDALAMLGAGKVNLISSCSSYSLIYRILSDAGNTRKISPDGPSFQMDLRHIRA